MNTNGNSFCLMLKVVFGQILGLLLVLLDYGKMNIWWPNDFRLLSFPPLQWVTTFAKQKFFDEMLDLGCDEMIIFWLNDFRLLFLFKFSLSVSIGYGLLLKQFFDPMLSLYCDEMNVLWPNDFRLITFFYFFLISGLREPTFAKEVFWFYAYFRLWRNELLDEMTDGFYFSFFYSQTIRKA